MILGFVAGDEVLIFWRREFWGAAVWGWRLVRWIDLGEIDHLMVFRNVSEGVVRWSRRLEKKAMLRERIRWKASRGSLGVPILVIVRRCSIRS